MKKDIGNVLLHIDQIPSIIELKYMSGGILLFKQCNLYIHARYSETGTRTGTRVRMS